MTAVLRRLWPAIAAVALFMALYVWHSHAVASARREGASAQGEVDRAAFAAAEQLATAEQDATIAVVRENSDAISKDADRALISQNNDLARRYAALRELWLSHRTNPRSASNDEAVTFSSTPSGVDAAPCAGGVAIETAIAASEAADLNAAQVNALIDWVEAQQAAWPQAVISPKNAVR